MLDLWEWEKTVNDCETVEGEGQRDTMTLFDFKKNVGKA